MDKLAIYPFLGEQKIPYEKIEHPAVFNMEQLASIHLPHPEWDAKNLFVRDDKKRNYYLITVKGDKRVDLKEFRRQHALRALSFASAEDSRRRLPARHSERHRAPRACLSGPGICRKQNRRAPQRQHRNRLAAGGRSAGAFETARKRSRIYGPVAPAFPPGALLHTHKISPDAFASGLICVTAISIFGPVLFYRSKKASSARQPSSISR